MTDNPPSRLWRVQRSVARLLLSLVASALVLGAGEAFFRVRESGTGPPPDRLVPDVLLGWAPRPDYTFTIRAAEFTVTERTNSFGLLGPEITRARPAGTARVLVLGDSMTEAVQVPRGERFVALVEAGLSGRIGRPAEVVNAGVTNYQTDQEVLYYERDGHTLQPNVVLLMLFVGNDVMGNASAQRQPGLGPAVKPRFRLVNGVLDLEPLPLAADGRPADVFDPHLTVAPEGGLAAVLASARSSFYRWSALYRAAADAAYALRTRIAAPAVPFGWLVFGVRLDPAVEEAWAVTAALLGRLREDVERDGARLGVVVIPDPLQVERSRWLDFLGAYRLRESDWDPDEASRRVCALSTERGIPCLDLLDGFRAAGEGLYFTHDRHLSAAGHQVLADAVLHWIAANELLR